MRNGHVSNGRLSVEGLEPGRVLEFPRQDVPVDDSGGFVEVRVFLGEGLIFFWEVTRTVWQPEL